MMVVHLVGYRRDIDRKVGWASSRRLTVRSKRRVDGSIPIYGYKFRKVLQEEAA